MDIIPLVITPPPPFRAVSVELTYNQERKVAVAEPYKGQYVHIGISIFGSRFNKNCADISIQESQELNGVKSYRYLGITVESATHLKCNISEAKK